MDRILTSAVSLAVAVSTLTQEALTVAALRARGRKEPVTLQVGRKDYITREIAVHPTKGECRMSPTSDVRELQRIGEWVGEMLLQLRARDAPPASDVRVTARRGSASPVGDTMRAPVEEGIRDEQRKPGPCDGRHSRVVQPQTGAVPSLGRGCSQPVIASRELTRIFT